MADKVEIFTDGACRGNPGPGGWGAILRFGGHEKELYGAEPGKDMSHLSIIQSGSQTETLGDR